MCSGVVLQLPGTMVGRVDGGQRCGPDSAPSAYAEFRPVGQLVLPAGSRFGERLPKGLTRMVIGGGCRLHHELAEQQ